MADPKKPVASKAASGKTTKKVSSKKTKKVAAKVAVKTKPAAKKARVAKKTASRKKTTKTKASATKTSKAQPTDNKFDQMQDLFQDNLRGLNTEKAEELARNVWLAGLGAYSRTFEALAEQQEDLQEKFQERYETMNAEGQKVFEELVSRGKELQDDAEKVMQQGRESLEDRVEDFKERFGGGLTSFIDIPGRLREAAEKIEEISDRLQKKK